MHTTKEQILKAYFGYDQFRPLQAEVIEHVVAGNDSLVLMPTGGGKSLCFQIPALLLDGLTLVISPLIALMKDQVEALRANGIAAAYLNSSLSAGEQQTVFREIKQGELKLLYIAPERLFSGNTFQLLHDWNISLFAIDESHCISSWGHDFRPEYRQLSALKSLFPKIPVIALTATADRVTRRDILKQLTIGQAQIFLSSFDRPNIGLSVLPGQKRLQQIIHFINRRPGQPGIVYCLSRKTTETVAEGLQRAGLKAGYYHAGLDSSERSAVQDQFIRDDLQVMVATVAFGMGIDKSNIRWVVHYNLPANLEGFYQEIGRAGRDGERADTVLFYSYSDIVSRQDMIQRSEQPEAQKELLRAKLERMQQYAQTDNCRRRMLLSYFNEETTADCGNCDSCRNPRSRFDGTIIAQKALSAISRTGQKVAMGMLIDILRGSHNRNLLQLGYDKLPTFGVGRDLRTEEWADFLRQLLNVGVMDIAYDEGHVFKLNALSQRVLKGGEKVQLVQFLSVAERKAREELLLPREKAKKEVIRDALFERLRALRKQLSDSIRIPPYAIFSDATLSEMAQKRPVSEAQLKTVSGVGEEKFRRYGVAFINEIIAFAKENTQPGTRIVKGMTYLDTLALYKEGYAIPEIAQKRDMTESTIVVHLIKLRGEGYPIVLKPLQPEKVRQEIAAGIREMGWRPGDPLRPLFDLFDGKYDYGQLHLCIAVMEDEKQLTAR